MHKTFGFFVVLSGLAILLTFLYIGLNVTEQGTQELVGLKETRQALFFATEERGLIITFAGREYALPWKLFWEKLQDIITEKVADV